MQNEYRQWRPAVEPGIAHLAAHGRGLHYLRAIKNDVCLHPRAAAINLRRLINLGLTTSSDAWTLTTTTR